ncbi:hypothetical protein Tco_0581221 [Tanacetum coccineum]
MLSPQESPPDPPLDPESGSTVLGIRLGTYGISMGDGGLCARDQAHSAGMMVCSGFQSLVQGMVGLRLPWTFKTDESSYSHERDVNPK